MFTLFRSRRLTVSLKPWHWCWPCYCSEAGLTAVQVGPLVLEIALTADPTP